RGPRSRSSRAARRWARGRAPVRRGVPGPPGTRSGSWQPWRGNVRVAGTFNNAPAAASALRRHQLLALAPDGLQHALGALLGLDQRRDALLLGDLEDLPHRVPDLEDAALDALAAPLQHLEGASRDGAARGAPAARHGA